jgi:hypothetical protein
MSELHGTSVIISDATGDIVGQGETSRTFAGAPVVISNKSYGDDVTYLDGELSGKQESIPMTIFFNTDTTFKTMRDNAKNGTLATYTLTYGATGFIIEGQFMVTAWSETFPHGAAVTASCTLMSSGEPTYTDPV